MSRGTWLGVACLLTMTLMVHVYFLELCGEGLSPVADSYSEANALRAGERYARDGFLVDSGLPYVSFGNRFPGEGITGEEGRVYHGYPPGPDWLAGVYTKVFGVERLSRFRLVPVALGMLASAVFLFGLIQAIGPRRGLAVYLSCLLTPMFTNMTHSLHCHGYVFSVLLLEVGLLLRILSRPGPIGPGWIVLMFLLGFAQGWLSFDHCFLVTFAAVPIALLTTPAGVRPSVKSLLALVFATGVGFTLAHVLHFLQTVTYFGGLSGALQEYASRAGKKYGLTGTELDGLAWHSLVGHGLVQMLVAFLRWTRVFSPASIVVVGLTTLACLLSRASGTLSHRFRVDAHFAPTAGQVCGTIVALLLGTVWLCVKPFHAINHMGFIARHLFLFYLCCGLLIAQATTLRIGWKQSGRSRWWPSRDVFKYPRGRGRRNSLKAIAAAVTPPLQVGLNGQHPAEPAVATPGQI